MTRRVLIRKAEGAVTVEVDGRIVVSVSDDGMPGEKPLSPVFVAEYTAGLLARALDADVGGPVSAPALPLPSSCAWCDVPERDHVQGWHPVPGLHGYVAPERWLIESRMRRRFQWAGKLPTLPGDPAGLRDENSEENQP